MATTRRTFLGTFLAAGAAPALSWADAGSPAFIAATREPDDSYALRGLRQSGEETFRIALPARGHAGAGHPFRPEAMAFARRPGSFALVIDCAAGKVLQQLAPPDGRQFNGHGVFDRKGSLLFTSEQESATSQGVVGVWNVAAGYRRIGEFPTGGIGPHDLRLMPGEAPVLVVANGGIATDPTDRTKLNIPTMQPNLTYLTTGGEILEQVALAEALHWNSIRHLAIAPDGRVAFAMQWEGDEALAPPLLGLHRRGEAPALASAPEADERAMDRYAGSIAFSGDGTEVAITSPRGGRLHRFSSDGTFLGAVSRTDICGLAPHPGGLLASDGLGGLITIGPDGPRPLSHSDCAWDNHIVAL